MNIDELLDSHAFNALDDEQKTAYKHVFEQIEGKCIAEAIYIIARAAKRLPKGKTLTKNEHKLMLDAFLASAPEKDREKYRKISSIVFRN